MNKDRTVLSFHDTLLHQSDIDLLKGPYWLNDKIISFYFEYLGNVIYKDASNMLFMTCEVTQCLKMVDFEEIPMFLDPLEFLSKEYIFFALNDNECATSAGGTHWSLLVYAQRERMFHHFDSMNDLNYDQAVILLKKVSHYIKGNLKIKSMSTPQQRNGHDCGIHVLYNAESLARYISENQRIDKNCLMPCNSCVTTKRSELIKLITRLSTNE